MGTMSLASVGELCRGRVHLRWVEHLLRQVERLELLLVLGGNWERDLVVGERRVLPLNRVGVHSVVLVRVGLIKDTIMLRKVRHSYFGAGVLPVLIRIMFPLFRVALLASRLGLLLMSAAFGAGGEHLAYTEHAVFGIEEALSVGHASVGLVRWGWKFILCDLWRSLVSR